MNVEGGLKMASFGKRAKVASYSTTSKRSNRKANTISKWRVHVIEIDSSSGSNSAFCMTKKSSLSATLSDPGSLSPFSRPPSLYKLFS